MKVNWCWISKWHITFSKRFPGLGSFSAHSNRDEYSNVLVLDDHFLMNLTFWQSSRFWVRARRRRKRRGGRCSLSFPPPSFSCSTSAGLNVFDMAPRSGWWWRWWRCYFLNTHQPQLQQSMNSTPTAISKHLRIESFRHWWCSYWKSNHKSNRNLFLTLIGNFIALTAVVHVERDCEGCLQ